MNRNGISFNVSRQIIMALKECFTLDAEEIQEQRLQLNGMRKDSTVILQAEMLLNKNQ